MTTSSPLHAPFFSAECRRIFLIPFFLVVFSVAVASGATFVRDFNQTQREVSTNKENLRRMEIMMDRVVVKLDEAREVNAAQTEAIHRLQRYSRDE